MISHLDSQSNCQINCPDKENYQVIIKNSSFIWDKYDFQMNNKIILKDITLRIKNKKLVAVVGPVGSGKSSLLSAITQEMYKLRDNKNGFVWFNYSNYALIPQQSWIKNDTIRNNILFGKEFDKNWYEKVVTSCELVNDFNGFDQKDKTEIGEKGANLSGGQKQRISIARAVYSKSDFYLFDDPISAVDYHVGKSIFDNVIGPQGLLKGKTRIVVTNNITILPKCDQIIVMKDGQICECGNYFELIERQSDFNEFLTEYLVEGPEEFIEPEQYHDIEEIAQQIRPHLERKFSVLSSGTSRSSFRSRFSSFKNNHHKNEIIKRRNQLKQEEQQNDKKLISDEKLQTGSVGWSVYKQYIKVKCNIKFIL